MNNLNNNLENVLKVNVSTKKESTKKETSEKDLKAKKDLAIERSKDKIKNPTSKVMINEKILELDFENLDLNNLKSLIKTNVRTKSISTKEKMYKFERNDLTKEQIKKERSKIRKQRTKFCSNILHFFSTDLKDNLKKEVVLFNKFYKETYLLNDYSISSLAQSNSDKETLVQLNLMLQIVKKFK